MYQPRLHLHKINFKKSSIPLPSDPNSLFEEVERIDLKHYVWLDALKATLPLLNMELYG